MKQMDLTDFGTRYAAAWSSQNPALFASFYAENGSLTVNTGPPSVGRSAITATARSYMTAFPDMVVKMKQMDQQGEPPDRPLALDRHQYGARRHRQIHLYDWL
jgi:hypothetical protein